MTVMSSIPEEELQHLYAKVNEQKAMIKMLERARDYWYARVEAHPHIGNSNVRRRLTLMVDMPTIVCLCGSTRFSQAFQDAALEETLKGNVVLSIGCNMRSDAQIFGHMSQAEQDAIKRDLDELHLRKIELADEILVLNVAGYIGESTRREIEHAALLRKPVRYLEATDG